LNLKGDIYIDIKTTLDCTERAFEMQAAKLGYNFQMGMGSIGVEEIVGKTPDLHLFVAVEKVPPYDFALYAADDTVLEVGRKQFKRAIRSLKVALDTNIWVAYQDFGVRVLTTPKWVMDLEGMSDD